jgi:hypothetical protein
MSEPNVDINFCELIDEERCEKMDMIKFCLCVLRCQQGKTFVAIKRIERDLKEDHKNGVKSVNVIFTMNTLLSSKQFSRRLSELESVYGKGTVCIVASKYNGEYTHVKNGKQLLSLCASAEMVERLKRLDSADDYDDIVCPKVIVMCSNKKRFSDGLDFLNTINEMKKKYGFRAAYAYYDELHEYLNDNLRSQIREINDLEIVKSIVAMTATPDRIFEEGSDFWSKIRLVELDDYSDKNYAGVDDMVWIPVDDYFETPYSMPRANDNETKGNQTVGFIEHVLDNYPSILQDNTRIFIPAHKTQVTHNRVRDLVFERNKMAIVVVINGPDKSLTYYDDFGTKKQVSLNSRDAKELCETMSEIIIRLGLTARSLVITGLICVSMGQTLTHMSLGSFTSAIFSHLFVTNDELYQLFGRTTGRMKDWDTYVQTHIYCPTIAWDRICGWEACSKNMALESSTIENIDKRFSQEDYRAPLEEMGHKGISAIGNIRKGKKSQSEIQSAKAKKALKQTSMRVPIIINDLDENDLIFTSSEKTVNGEGEKRDYVVSLLRDNEKYNCLYNFVTNSTTKCVQITRSTSGKSYKKHITDVVEAAANNKPYIVDGKKEHKTINNWQVFVDKKGLRICIVLWVVDSSLY